MSRALRLSRTASGGQFRAGLLFEPTHNFADTGTRARCVISHAPQLLADAPDGNWRISLLGKFDGNAYVLQHKLQTLRDDQSQELAARNVWPRPGLGQASLGIPGLAQVGYPNKPVRLVVGYSAGGGVDAVARRLAPRLGAVLGQSCIVENRAGASGVIAADTVAKATPDGYTFFIGDTATLVAPFLQVKLPFDITKSFTPVARLFRLPLIVAASNDFPAKNPRDLISALKAAPGKYSYGTPGIGTVQHLGFELLKVRTGTFLTHIPYRGAAQIIPDLIGGQLQLAALSASSAMSQAKSGRVRPIGIMSNDKLLGAEGVPSFVDVIPGFDAAPTLFMLAPDGTPQAIVERLNQAISSLMSDPQMRDAAAQQSAVPAFLPSPAHRTWMTEESERWGAIVRNQKITAG